MKRALPGAGKVGSDYEESECIRDNSWRQGNKREPAARQASPSSELDNRKWRDHVSTLNNSGSRILTYSGYSLRVTEYALQTHGLLLTRRFRVSFFFSSHDAAFKVKGGYLSLKKAVLKQIYCRIGPGFDEFSVLFSMKSIDLLLSS